MKARQINSIFIAMALATVSILVLQGYIWQQSIGQEEQRFEDSVERAVARLTHELHGSDSGRAVFVDAMSGSGLNQLSGSQTFEIHSFDSPFDSLHVINELVMNSIDSLFLSGTGFSDSLHRNVTIKIESDCQACTSTADLPGLERIRPILTERLALDGITSDFDFGVVDLRSGKWIKNPGENFKQVESSDRSFQILASAFDSPVSKESELRLYFPNEKWHVLRKLATSLALSGLLALSVLACLAFSLKTILRQKQLSEIKSDFINNMTHELKTPIATISLASEALADEEVKFPPEKRAEYLGMISSEAGRLSDQVEKVLQMSLIDKGDLGLKIVPINIHSLIEECVGGFKLKIQQRKGDLNLILKAKPEMIAGDPMHVRQMVSNLLDNAEKYSPDNPELSIETTTVEEGIQIAVSDKGMGIGRDKLKRIFDRFYRIPSGNVHDVKGFGLGLAYVMSMAEAHGGKVSASSKPGQGSTFFLTLPYADA